MWQHQRGHLWFCMPGVTSFIGLIEVVRGYILVKKWKDQWIDLLQTTITNFTFCCSSQVDCVSWGMKAHRDIHRPVMLLILSVFCNTWSFGWGLFIFFSYQVSDTAQKLVTCGMWCLMLLWCHSHCLYKLGEETLCGSFLLFLWPQT